MADRLRSYCSELLRMLTNLRVCNVEEDRDGYFLTAGRCFGYIDCLRDSASVTGEVAKRMRDLVESACTNSWRGAIPDARNAGPCIPFHIAIDRRRAAEQPPVQAGEPDPQKPIRPSWLDGGLEALEMVKEDMTAEPVAVEADSRPPESMVDALSEAAFSDVPFSIVNERRAVNFDAVKPQAQDSANEKSEPVPAPAPRRELRLLCLLVPSFTGIARSLPIHTMRPMPPRVSVQGRWNLASETGFHLRETQAAAPAPPSTGTLSTTQASRRLSCLSESRSNWRAKPMSQLAEVTDAYVLCQDCGHAEAYSAAKHMGDERCPNCEGEFCGCNFCSGVARLSIQFEVQAEAERWEAKP